MNQNNTTVVPTPPQYSLFADVIETLQIGAFVGAFIWCLLALSACGVSAGPVTIGTTSYLAEANKGRIALSRQPIVAASREVQ